MSRFGAHLGSGVTVRYDFGTKRKKLQIYYARFLFIYFEQTVVQIIVLLQSENTKYYIKLVCFIYIYIYNLQYIYTYKE